MVSTGAREVVRGAVVEEAVAVDVEVLVEGGNGISCVARPALSTWDLVE